MARSASQPAAHGRRSRELLVFGLIIATIWLAAQIVSQGLSDEFARSRPGVAVLWRPDSAEALTSLAEQRLLARDPGRAAAFARKALRREPLDVAALSLLGVALDQAGYHDRAESVLAIAGERGWRDALTQFWLFGDRLRGKRYDEAFERADVVLRRFPDLDRNIYPLMAFEALRTPGASQALLRRLEASPSWRPGFIGFLAADRRDPSQQLLQNLLASLGRGHTPPTPTEVGVVAAQLAARGDYLKAHSLWETLTPSSRSGLIVDGGFDQTSAEGPFAWSFANGVGWASSVESAPGPDHGKALRVEYDGVSPPQPVGQLLALSGGAYLLSGDVEFETSGGSGALRWTVSCADTSQVLGAAAPPATALGQWRRFQAAVVVPSTGCQGQRLRLEATPGERTGDTIAWFDNLAISPALRGDAPG